MNVKRKAQLIVSCLCILMFASACASTENEDKQSLTSASSTTSSAVAQKAAAEYRFMSQDEAKEVMDGDAPFTLVDVRTQEEFDQQHIKGAILIPDYEISARAPDELPNKDALILVYCRTGRRSKDAANALVSLGYTNVYDFGGITSWPYDNIE